MHSPSSTPERQHERTVGRIFAPKLLTTLREGYGFADFRRDAMAGLTVSIVALPLAMAFAIASGAAPNQGLITAVVAGFLISALGGSRYQIGGPTGAFVVVVFNVIQQFGYDGLVGAGRFRRQADDVRRSDGRFQCRCTDSDHCHVHDHHYGAPLGAAVA